MAGFVILVKLDEMYSILEILLATGYSRDEIGIGWLKSLLESVIQSPHVYYIPVLSRGKLHLLVRSKEILHCIHMLFANPSTRFHQNISICTNSCFLRPDLLPCSWKPFRFQEVLVSCGNSHINILSKQVLRKWMHFQNVLSECCSKSKTCHM